MHHTHAARSTHTRSAHANNIQIHPVPSLPQATAIAGLQHQLPPTQGGGIVGGGATAATSTSLPKANAMNQLPQQHMRDHQNRSTNPKHLQSTIHNSNLQMQKIRQQHQQHKVHSSNSSNNNNSSTSSSNIIQLGSNNLPQQQQQYSHLNVSQQKSMGALQQQQQQTQSTHRNVAPVLLQQQNSKINTLQMKNHLPNQQSQQPMVQSMTNMALRQVQPIAQTRQINQQHNKNYNYLANNKYKNNNNNNYNNNNNIAYNPSSTITAPATTTTTTNFGTPKAILQNPNRIAKAQKSSPEVNATKDATTKPSSNNITIVPETIANDESSQANDSNRANAGESSKSCLEGGNEANKENILETTAETLNPNESNHLTNDILPNVDSAVTKHTKEKTPMCLVNELARYNKITHQYRLTGEKGPAHCKRFTVTLKLGDEEYTAEGFKIKKAQHLAAAQAIEKTAYKHPTPKLTRNYDDGRPRPYIMPTVELNALAMKLGQQTYYLFDPRQMPPPPVGVPPPPPPPPPADVLESAHDGSIPTHHHYGGPRPPLPPPLPPNSVAGHNSGHIMHSTSAHHPRIVHEANYGGPRRHYEAHSNIHYPPAPPPHMQVPHPQRGYVPHRGYAPLQRYHQRYPMIHPPPPPVPHHMHPHFGVPSTPYKITLIVGKQKFVGVGRTLQQAKHDAASRALQVLKAQNNEQVGEDLNDSVDETDAKSPISQVHEAGIKRNMMVHFKILREEGPAHMRNFITACIVGSIVTEGEGHGKKISKKRAAEKMLLELKKLPPVTPVKSPTKRIKVKTPGKVPITPSAAKMSDSANAPGNYEKRGRRSNVSLKEKMETDDESPVTKLIQLQQNLKEKEPVFEFIAKNGNEKVRRREFIVEVTAQGVAARGMGSSKKLAKRNAAENLLKALEEAGKCLDLSTKNSTATQAAENNEKKPTTITPTKSRESIESIIENAKVPVVATTAGQVPGILILRQNKKNATKKKEVPPTVTTSPPTVESDLKKSDCEAPSSQSAGETTNVPQAEENASIPVSIPTPAPTTSNDDVAANSSTTAATTASSTSTSTVNSNSSTSVNTSSSSSAPNLMKHQLLYLAKLLGFEVNFSDYPKGNHNEFLTIVALSTDPPQICHGFGKSTDESQNDAARNALKILSDLGLNNAKSN